MTTPGNVQRARRVVFVDQARALAIVLMLFGHSFDRFLGEPWRSGPAYSHYQFFRGISSALFILLAGFSFSIATLPKLSAYLGPTRQLYSRFRRIGLILGLGFVLQLWAPTLFESVATYTPARLEHLFGFNVLQNIGSSLLLLHLLALATRQEERFLVCAGLGAMGIFAVAPLTYSAEVDARLPGILSAMGNLYHDSRFPLVPFAGFSLLGAVLGGLFLRARKSGSEVRMMLAQATFGLGLVAFDLILRKFRVEVFPYTTLAPDMPGFTFARAGTSMLLIAGLFGLGRAVLVLPSLSKLVSIESLSIYFVHLLLVYGCASFPGLLPGEIRAMGPVAMWIWNAFLLCSMIGMAKAISLARTAVPKPLAALRHLAILAAVLNFLLAPGLHPAWLIGSVIVSIAILTSLHRIMKHVT